MRALVRTFVGSVVLTAALLPAGQARADVCSNPVPLSASVNAASGNAYVCWTVGRYGGYYFGSIKDTRADGHPVYLAFMTNGGEYRRHWNRAGNGTVSDFYDQSFSYKPNQPATTVAWVAVKVCVDDRFSDTCSTSQRLYNPYH